MKVKCISKEMLQDANDPKKFYYYMKEYTVTEERGKELIETGKFMEVKEPKKAKETKDN